MSHFRSSRLSFAIHVGTMLLLLAHSQSSLAAEADKFSLAVWPDLAPGENSREVGIAEPPREGEDPPVTRLTRIRKPSLEVFLPENPNGAAILVLPGGGFAKVVPDKEGSEAARLAQPTWDRCVRFALPYQ